ncbi:MAG: hypothetical protein HKO10_04990, partial [Acidimicrobiia bacterium]|nr:hypothetical protein [Acidimicrobiia bacterium]
PPEGATPQVQEAVEQAEAAVEVGIPADFTIEFGDADDWIQFKAGEWLKGELKWMRPFASLAYVLQLRAPPVSAARC